MPGEPTDGLTRQRIVDVAEALLHDWVKYMNMWLGEVDWTHPPDDIDYLLRRGILETRKSRQGTQGVADIWATRRPALEELTTSPQLSERIDELDRVVEGLVRLAENGLSAGENPAHLIARPGEILRGLLTHHQPDG